MFDFVLRIFFIFLCVQNILLGFYNFHKKMFGDLPFSNIPPTNTTSSSKTTSTLSIPRTNMRSTGLHPHIYSRLWLFQIRTAASEIEANGICLFRTFLLLTSNIMLFLERNPTPQPIPNNGVSYRFYNE